MSLVLSNISVKLGPSCLIQPFSLEIGAGEIVTLMGPSGCGKSSLLSFLGGTLETPLTGSGNLSLDGQDLLALPPFKRRIGRLFQDDLLFPHMTVGENLLFGMKREEAKARKYKAEVALQNIGLEGFWSRDPSTLSGGQRARVALMRALLAEPRAMLLDEPFNKLDEDLRLTTRRLTFEHILKAAMPCLLVTHDKADRPAQCRLLVISKTGEVRDA